jgi:hypothetical protein
VHQRYQQQWGTASIQGRPLLFLIALLHRTVIIQHYEWPDEMESASTIGNHASVAVAINVHLQLWEIEPFRWRT